MNEVKEVFPRRWRPAHPERLQLYSMATPNGQKIGIALEELGLVYEAHKIDILRGDQFDEDYVALVSPNSKIPTMIDPDGPGGAPIAFMESGAILLYLAEKTGRLVPSDPRLRWETTQWLFFQVGHVGPMVGQFGHFFKFAPDRDSHGYEIERYGNETRRLLGVLDRRLEGRSYLVGDDLTAADIATLPWINVLEFYEGKEHVGYESFENVVAWVERCLSRPAFQRGMKVCA